MRIAFLANNKKWGGLANNGGSNTIIKSCQALKRLGHEPHIVTKVNRYTWEKQYFNTPRMPLRPDAVIAASISDIHKLMKLKGDFCRAYWMRGWEKWQMSEENIVHTLRNFSAMGGRIITNSTWQHKHLLTFGIRSKVCFAGFNLKFWGQKKDCYEEDKIVIGGLYNVFHARTKHFSKLEKLSRHLDRNKYHIYGLSATKPQRIVRDKFNRFEIGIHGNKLAEFYSYCDIWFAPTTLEGFHNPPAEANLCGSLVLCNKNFMNGMSDYANDETAVRWFKFTEALDVLRNPWPFWKRREAMKKRIQEHIGSRETNMTRMVGLLS